FGVNPGMSSRIAHHLDFAAYELDELTAIGQLMLDGSRYYLSEPAEQAFRNYLTQRMRQPRFANARSVRNELERARLRHAHRLASDLHRHWTRDDLMRLEAEDIFADDPELLLAPFQSLPAPRAAVGMVRGGNLAADGLLVDRARGDPEDPGEVRILLDKLGRVGRDPDHVLPHQHLRVASRARADPDGRDGQAFGDP